MPHLHQLADHLFRREAGKMVSVLTRHFGFAQREIAEDLVQETLVAALTAWRSGVPDDPAAWLYRVARNKAVDYVRREKHFQEISDELAYLAERETGDGAAEGWFTEPQIQDSQLRMMFACCHPALPTEGQIALILKSLCGMSVREIAQAFLTTPDTIEKRLYRTREKIRQQGISLDLPTDTDLAPRLGNVLKTLYLLFNEGYHSQSESLVRVELLEDAMRFVKLLTEFPPTDQPAVRALLALMCFQTARIDGRFDPAGGMLLLADQNRDQWNQPLIRQGIRLLLQSATGDVLTPYHLEAAIAHEHAIAPTYAETNWRQLLHYYDLLLALEPSPVVALNRAVVVAELNGPEAALRSLDALPDGPSLEPFHLYHAVRAEFHERLNQPDLARQNWEKALKWCGSAAERVWLLNRLQQVKSLPNN